MFWNKKVATTEKPKERAWRELLRENLGTISVDTYYLDDPILVLSKEERKMYLQHFLELSKDKRLMERLKYLINKQANLTLKNLSEAKSSESDMAGAMNINGLGLIRDEIQNLASLYLKENNPTDPLKGMDRFKVM